MSARKKLTGAELELAAIQHALSEDPTRAHLAKPFGCEWQGRGYIAAADGHRLALVRSSSWREHLRADAPRAAGAIEAGLLDCVYAGELYADEFKSEARVFPKFWRVVLMFDPLRAERPALRIEVTRKGSKEERALRPLGERAEISWCAAPDQLRHPLGLDLSYLVDAIEFCGTPAVHMYSRGELDPVVLIPSKKGGHALEHAVRIAVIMPVRT